MRECHAVLNIKGESFPCDFAEGRHHPGWAHSNKAAQAVWASHEEIEQGPVFTGTKVHGCNTPTGPACWCEREDQS